MGTRITLATFGLLHLSIYRILPTGTFGVLLCFAALRSRSLWVPVVIHALHNGVLLTWSTQGDPSQTPGLPVLVLGGAVALAAVVALGRR